MSITQRAKGSWVLRAIIVVLIGVLAYVIYEPYQRMLAVEALKKESRMRMSNLRSAQLKHIELKGYYATTLDSLMLFINTDSLMVANRDTVFTKLSDGTFHPDSLYFSPKTHQPYRLTADNTSAIKKYFLECPDGFGSIGSLEDDARINKGSWED